MLELYAAKIVLKKPLDVLALVPPGAQFFDGAPVQPGPALRADTGQDHTQSQGARFPDEIAVRGAQVTIESSQASMECDRENILREIAGVAAPSPVPEVHAGYDKVNQKVRQLFQAAGMRTLAMFGDATKLQKMLEQGGTRFLEDVDPQGSTALLKAACNGRCEAVELLLAHKANTETIQCGGMRPIHHAAKHGYDTVIQLLVSAGATVNALNSHAETARDVALKSGHETTAHLLSSMESA